MAYATLTYYKSTYLGATATDAEITKQLDRASDVIDITTGYGIVTADLTEFQTGLLQKACCAQAESFILDGDDGDLSSASIGKFSYSTTAKKAITTTRCTQFLEQAGLMNRAIPRAGSNYYYG
jgi:hypothetical protein